MRCNGYHLWVLLHCAFAGKGDGVCREAEREAEIWMSPNLRDLPEAVEELEVIT